MASKQGLLRDGSIDSTQIIKDSLDSPTPSENIANRSHGKRRKKGKVSVWSLLTQKGNRSALFVLFVMLITYMFNQVDRYLQAITAKQMQKSQNWGPGDGTGYQEDLLVGAVFTVVYLPSGIPFGFMADSYPKYKKYILSFSLCMWSLSVIWTGISTKYWEVMVGRFILGIFESACTPMAASILSDHFTKESRTTALGIYNWGIYTGYSLAYGVANLLTDLTTWRTVWFCFGGCGVVWSIFVLMVPTESHIQKMTMRKKQIQAKHDNKQKPKLCEIVKVFCKTPSLVILLIGSLIRNAGGYVWAFNAANFFDDVRNQSGTQQAEFMQWIPLFAGCVGSFFGGFISDRYVKKSEPWKRLLILVLSNLLAAPFAALALLLPAWYCYLMLIPSNVIGEMWVGICLSMVIDLVPANMKTTSLSVYFFWIGLAGFFPLLVTPLQDYVFGKGNVGYTLTLLTLWPGLYVASSLIFLVSLIFLKRDTEKAKSAHPKSVRL